MAANSGVGCSSNSVAMSDSRISSRGAVATGSRAWHFSVRSFLETVAAPLRMLAEEQALHVFRREGFLQLIDRLGGKDHFAQLWSSGAALRERWC